MSREFSKRGGAHAHNLKLVVVLAALAGSTGLGTQAAENVAPKSQNPVSTPTITVAGDLLGHVVGTVSRAEGTAAVKDAAIEVSGRTPAGPWRSSAKTDERGFFRADLSCSSAGLVKISATDTATNVVLTVDSADLARRLTPRPARGSHSRLSLTGKWSFVADPPRDFAARTQSLEWRAISVPAHWEMEGFVCESGLGLYRKAFTIPKAWSGKRIKFRAEAIYSHCEVFVNGRCVGSHEGGATPFELDITEATRGGENEMMILVEGLSNAANFDRMTYFAYFNLAGIWRPLEVFAVEPAHVSRLAISTTFDPEFKNADLSVEVDVANEQSVAVQDAELKLRVFDPKGKVLDVRGLSSRVSVPPWETRSVKLRAKIAAPEHWNAEKPKLYKLVAQLDGSRTVPTSVQERFGFRQVDVKGRVFQINGKPIKFRGVSRLDAHPLTGRYLTAAINKQDIELMKQANFNALRACVFPSHPYTMDLTDEQGLYVENDGPFCFVWDAAASQDLRNAPFMLSVMSEYLERDRNRPSVVIWSICNESAFGRDFEMVHQFIRQSDPTRPCGTGQSGNLEIATYHCPMSYQKLADTKDLPMPVINDESFGIFHGWGTLAWSIELDPGLRDYWVTHIQELLDAARQRDNFLGTMQFSWVDDKFLVPNKGIQYWRDFGPPIHFADREYKMPRRGNVGDYVWGTVDGWRRPRPEWWLSKKANSPIRIEEKPLSIPEVGASICVPVENLNFWRDLEDYVCKWQLGSEKGRLRPPVAPQTKGVITIPAKHQPKATETLVLEFHDETGRMVDGYKLSFRPHEIPALPNSGRPARVQEMSANSYLQTANAIRLLGNETELSYDKRTGQMMWCLAGGEPVILSGPTLHLMRYPGHPAPYPDPGTWKLGSADCKTEKGQAVLHWDGKCGAEFTGGFEIRMDDAGDVEMAYRFTYDGKQQFSAREIGLGFEIPIEMGRLEWDRNAEWSYYPDDHIGRPHGVAQVHSTFPQVVPPKDRPYAQDDHPWGCNDFRSTKRHIYWATLLNREGAGIRVISDGTDSIRATMGPDTLAVRVMNHFDGSPAGISEYDGQYGTGKLIKPGDLIQGVVRLQLQAGRRAE